MMSGNMVWLLCYLGQIDYKDNYGTSEITSLGNVILKILKLIKLRGDSIIRI